MRIYADQSSHNCKYMFIYSFLLHFAYFAFILACFNKNRRQLTQIMFSYIYIYIGPWKGLQEFVGITKACWDYNNLLGLQEFAGLHEFAKEIWEFAGFTRVCRDAREERDIHNKHPTCKRCTQNTEQASKIQDLLRKMKKFTKLVQAAPYQFLTIDFATARRHLHF